MFEYKCVRNIQDIDNDRYLLDWEQKAYDEGVNSFMEEAKIKLLADKDFVCMHLDVLTGIFIDFIIPFSKSKIIPNHYKKYYEEILEDMGNTFLRNIEEYIQEEAEELYLRYKEELS